MVSAQSFESSDWVLLLYPLLFGETSLVPFHQFLCDCLIEESAVWERFDTGLTLHLVGCRRVDAGA